MTLRPSCEDNLRALYNSVPLGTNRRAIRVLDLYPSSNPRSKIRADLRPADVDSSTNYEALSYTWGESKEARTIAVNGTYRVPVTDNLFNALRRLRRKSSVRKTWVDAICINQHDTHDKGRQIGLMHLIYRQATCVNVWLGESGFTGPVYIANFLHPGDWRFYCHVLNGCRERKDLSPFKSSIRNHVRMIDKAIKNTTPRWHDRAWIVQEFILAREVFICFANKRVKFSTPWLDTPSLLGYHSQERQGTSRAFFTQISKFVDFYNFLAHHENKSKPAHPLLPENIGLWDIIRFLREGQLTDHRDHIYSVLGLIGSKEADLISPDCDKSCPQVFATATYASIKARQNFDILDYVSSNRTTAGLPTWCVDFAMRKSYNVSNTSWQSGEQSDDGILQQNGYPRPIQRLDLESSTLRLTIAAGRFTVVKEVLPVSNDSWLDLSTLLDFFRHSWSFIACSRSTDTLIQSFGGVEDLRADQDEEARDYCSEMIALLERQHKDEIGFTIADQRVGVMLEMGFRTWAMLSGFEDHCSYQSWMDAKEANDADDFLHWPTIAAVNWTECQHQAEGVSVVSTSLGLVALAPKGVAAGDRIVVVQANEPLLTLRQNGSFYTFHGKAKVFGIDGMELVQAWHQLGIEEEVFVLQ